MNAVRGYCPMGCGRTLFLSAAGNVTCMFVGCPEPSAVSKILCDRETEHIVRFAELSFDLQHPLRERLNGELFNCGLHQRLLALHGPPVAPGRYRVHFENDAWAWEVLP